jgi:CheY-like chemotaxis protein
MSYRYGPHKCAKVLHSAFCEKSPQITPESTTEAQKPSSEMPKLASTINYEPFEKDKLFLPNATERKDFVPDPTELLSPRGQPFSQTQGITDPKKEPKSCTPKEKEMRVLLVEDNEINLKLLVATMRKLKIIHATAMNGLEALNAYKDCRGQFDVVFMDISMPVMSGIDSAKHIRRFERDEKLAATKLIALTGAANPTTRQEAFNVGVDLYLTKPVPMRELRGMLEEIKKESAFDIPVKG